MLKQALALLLTINRTPQLYYGTEILMNGTKEITDGDVRKDFPGGFVGDTRNAFTREGRTKAENEMFDWLSKLLHWRKGNAAITKGKQTQFIPWKGVYVIARRAAGKTVLTVLNGKRSENKMEVERYAEVIGSTTTARDILTGQTVDMTQDIVLPQRGVMILQF
jgi:glycosidase